MNPFPDRLRPLTTDHNDGQARSVVTLPPPILGSANLCRFPHTRAASLNTSSSQEAQPRPIPSECSNFHAALWTVLDNRTPRIPMRIAIRLQVDLHRYDPYTHNLST